MKTPNDRWICSDENGCFNLKHQGCQVKIFHLVFFSSQCTRNERVLSDLETLQTSIAVHTYGKLGSVLRRPLLTFLCKTTTELNCWSCCWHVSVRLCTFLHQVKGLEVSQGAIFREFTNRSSKCLYFEIFRSTENAKNLHRKQNQITKIVHAQSETSS